MVKILTFNANIMKLKFIQTLMITAITMAAMCVPATANAQLGGLVNKAKQKAKETVDKKKDDAKKEGKNQAKQAKMQALETQRPELPWPMTKDGTYNGMDVETFISQMEICKSTEAKQLKDKMLARYNHNKTILATPGLDNQIKESVEQEQERFLDFYYCIRSKVDLMLTNVPTPVTDGKTITFDTSNATWFFRGHMTSYSAVEENGKVFFRNYLSGDKAFLDEEDMELATAEKARALNYCIVTTGLRDVLDSGSQEYNNLWFLYDKANVYTDRFFKAVQNNSPENIEYRAMPKAGSMNAKYKAEALAIAKESNKDVIDVIITSSDWDVKMKGLVPDHRSIYGYIVTQDKYGKKCSSRAWTQSYQGNGNYGKLGGVGDTSEFYVK